MKNIVVFFGGKSCEHDISIITALQVLNNLDKSKYIIYGLFVDKNGNFYFANREKLLSIKNFNDYSSKLDKVTMIDGQSGIYKLKNNGKTKLLLSDYFALLCFHGKNGEDGIIQAILESHNIAYSSSGICQSAICMDKIYTKQLLSSVVNVLPFEIMNRYELDNDIESSVTKLLKKIDLPCIVKPANLGSSIGIKIANTREEIIEALIFAFSYDSRVIIEKLVSPIREVNCSVLGFNDNIQCSYLEEPISLDEILSFSDKYLKGSKGMVGQRRVCPAEISDDLKTIILEYSALAFKFLNLCGICRIDYIIDQNQNVYLNEINSIPGSLSYYLWAHIYSFSELLDKLIEFGIQKQKDLEKNIISFSSCVLNDFNNSIKK